MFLGNGLIAIVAGLLAHALVEYGKLGPVAPFDAAAAVMAVGGAVVMLTWSENYGDNSERRSFRAQLSSAAHAIAKGARRRARPLRTEQRPEAAQVWGAALLRGAPAAAVHACGWTIQESYTTGRSDALLPVHYSRTHLILSCLPLDRPWSAA